MFNCMMYCEMFWSACRGVSIHFNSDMFGRQMLDMKVCKSDLSFTIVFILYIPYQIVLFIFNVLISVFNLSVVTLDANTESL